MINPSVLNAQTHAWLSQFDHRPVGPLEATEITQVLSWAAGQLTLVCAASHDAAEISTLQATLSDIASAIQIYQQLGRDAQMQAQERYLYALQAQQQAAMSMLQTEMQTAARMSRALQPPPSAPPGYQPFPAPYNYSPGTTSPYAPRYNTSPYATPYPTGTPWLNQSMA